jgi:hypothetical protein
MKLLQQLLNNEKIQLLLFIIIALIIGGYLQTH